MVRNIQIWIFRTASLRKFIQIWIFRTASYHDCDEYEELVLNARTLEKEAIVFQHQLTTTEKVLLSIMFESPRWLASTLKPVALKRMCIQYTYQTALPTHNGEFLNLADLLLFVYIIFEILWNPEMIFWDSETTVWGTFGSSGGPWSIDHTNWHENQFRNSVIDPSITVITVKI